MVVNNPSEQGDTRREQMTVTCSKCEALEKRLGDLEEAVANLERESEATLQDVLDKIDDLRVTIGDNDYDE